MKKVINGKMYNTETAQDMAEWSNNLSMNDFRHCTETLYRKSSGEYFMLGEGGGLTAYRRAVDINSWTGGKAIVPLTLSEAQEWVEAHFSGDTYEAIFGEVAE